MIRYRFAIEGNVYEKIILFLKSRDIDFVFISQKSSIFLMKGVRLICYEKYIILETTFETKRTEWFDQFYHDLLEEVGYQIKL